MKAAKLPDYQYLIGLLVAAEEGDQGALQQAQKISSQLAKRANVRLKALEDKDFEASPAYMRVRDTIGRDRWRVRFSESKKLSVDQLETQLEELSIFLRDESGTISGEKLRRSGLDTMIDEGAIVIEEDEEKVKRAMLRFLESDAWTTYKKLAGYVSGNMQSIVNAIENGNTLKDFEGIVDSAKKQIASGKKLEVRAGLERLQNAVIEWEKM